MTSSTRKTQGGFCAMIFDCFARKTHQRSRRNIPTFPCNANRAKYRSERISVSTQGIYYKKISTSVTQSTILLSRDCLARLGQRSNRAVSCGSNRTGSSERLVEHKLFLRNKESQRRIFRYGTLFSRHGLKGSSSISFRNPASD